MTDKRTRVAVIRQRHSQTPAVAANISSRDFLSRDTSPILGREQWPRCCPGQYPRLFKNNSRDYIYFLATVRGRGSLLLRIRGALLITLTGLFEGWIVVRFLHYEEFVDDDFVPLRLIEKSRLYSRKRISLSTESKPPLLFAILFAIVEQNVKEKGKKKIRIAGKRRNYKLRGGKIRNEERRNQPGGEKD